MKTKLVVGAIAAFAVSAITPAYAADKASIELFGVTLKGASRERLREAFKANRLDPTREDEHYWMDTYNPGAVLIAERLKWI